MELFTRRDRIAITIITALILVGWGWRYIARQAEGSGEVRVLRGAIPLPPGFDTVDDPIAEFPGLDSKININTAGRSELESLPGIGEVKADAILEYRDTNGPFDSPEGLLKVNGIGPATLDRIRNLIMVSADSTAQE